MYIARLLYPVKVLGPGNRLAIWFCGCNHKCPGCCSTELWRQQEKYLTDADKIMHLVNSVRNTSSISGFTLTGGDPFLQPEALRELLPRLKEISPDILVYTGFDYEKINTPENQDILKNITVLIDGKYIEERNTDCFLRGSDNQRIHILQPEYRDFYEHYLQNGTNSIQNFKLSNGFISVGIPGRNYLKMLGESLQKKGIYNQKHH